MSINIAIDGPAGAGKSTIARKAAAELGFIYVDTGALYRSVAYYSVSKGADVSVPENVEKLLPGITPELRFIEGVQHVFVNGEDVSDKIRTPQVSMAASKVSAIPAVRAFLFELQQKIARENNVIMDGRDIGTVVLPNADLKIFLTASPEARADRRFKELKDKPDAPSYEEVLADIIKRDHDDSTRAIAPLKQAEDAVLCDTTSLSLEESVDKIIGMIKKLL
ncbi:MAG: (d)CMP kinase [Huintestinicola sp.]|uniref:(d)CMP kinase n=1 Tax=Huintestinicola sp. TaxID=2981661 RepID=UPI003F122B1C